MSEHVFFINSRAPDIQGLITGVEPGDLTELSSISIAGHGSSSIPPATSF
jgi:hypothetical protein